MGCACPQCDYARGNPDYKDGMVVSLALVDEAQGKVRSHVDRTQMVSSPSETDEGVEQRILRGMLVSWRRAVVVNR